MCYSITAKPSKHEGQKRMVLLVLFYLILYVPWIRILLVVTHSKLGSTKFFSLKTVFQYFSCFFHAKIYQDFFSSRCALRCAQEAYLPSCHQGCIQCNSSGLPGCGKLHPYTSQIRRSFSPLGTDTNTYTTALLPPGR